MALENLSGQPHDHDAAGARVRRGFIALRDIRIPACFCTDEFPDNTPSNHRPVPDAVEDPNWDMEAGELRFMGFSRHIVAISPMVTQEQMRDLLREMTPVNRAAFLGYARVAIWADRVNRELEADR